MSPAGPLILTAAAFVLLASTLRIAQEHERFAAFLLGKFRGWRGPGLRFKNPFGNEFWVKISVGDRGELISEEVARFKTRHIPVQTEGSIEPGKMVRISAFRDSAAVVTIDADQRRTLKCEKCGHEMVL